MPVQPVSTTVSARYSSAASPTEAALTRIGRSLVTRTTSLPSLRQLRATARMRVSLSPSRKPGGQHRGVAVVELDAERSALVADRERLVETAVGQPQVVERPQRRTGEVAQLGMVPFGLELGDDDDREHDLVLGEPGQRPRVGEQDTGVEDVGAPGGGRCGHSFSFGRSPRRTTWESVLSSGGPVPTLGPSAPREKTRANK